jgi:transcription termination/antitermination protein NusG
MMDEYQVGDQVRVKQGPFASFPARVVWVAPESLLLRVEVKIFGRTTPPELFFSDVERIEDKHTPRDGYSNN